MIANPTTLIVGAGASVELDYPTGAELREWIIERRGQNLDFGEARGHYQKELSWRFGRSLIPSIDAFLAEKENEDLRDWGVLCIACALLPVEYKKKNAPPAWLRMVFNAVRGKASDERKHKLKIVTFNYDLSIEYFLFHAFQAAHSLTPDQARARFDESIEIIHVYGHLGQIKELGGEHEYGGGDLFRSIQRARKDLRIIGRAPDDPRFTTAHDAIESAEFLAVLGFGFDEINIANLRLVDLAKSNPIVSTGWGLGCGMRGWVTNMGFSSLIFGRPNDDVPTVLQKSAFFQWANSPGRTAIEMHEAIFTGKRLLPEGE
jgi:hypothetical protein